MSDDNAPDAVRWFTRARRFPQLIGRLPDGTKIPGGPYTVTQSLSAAGLLIVGLNTTGIWARFGLLGNTLVLACVTASLVWLLGRIPVGARSPLSVATGLVHAVRAPSTGRMGGRAVRIRRPHRLRHTVVVALTHPDASTPAPAAPDPGGGPVPAGPPGAAPSRHSGTATPADPRPHRPRPRTGVQALLASAAPTPAARHLEEPRR